MAVAEAVVEAVVVDGDSDDDSDAEEVREEVREEVLVPVPVLFNSDDRDRERDRVPAKVFPMLFARLEMRDARVGAADAVAVAVAVGARGSCVAICDSWRINGVSGSLPDVVVDTNESDCGGDVRAGGRCVLIMEAKRTDMLVAACRCWSQRRTKKNG